MSVGADLARLDRHHAVAVEAADVAAARAHHDAVDLAVGHQLGLADGALDRLHGGVDVDHDAALQALRRRGAEADHVRAVVLHRGDQHRRLVRAEVEPDVDRLLARHRAQLTPCDGSQRATTVRGSLRSTLPARWPIATSSDASAPGTPESAADACARTRRSACSLSRQAPQPRRTREPAVLAEGLDRGPLRAWPQHHLGNPDPADAALEQVRHAHRLTQLARERQLGLRALRVRLPPAVGIDADDRQFARGAARRVEHDAGLVDQEVAGLGAQDRARASLADRDPKAIR